MIDSYFSPHSRVTEFYFKPKRSTFDTFAINACEDQDDFRNCLLAFDHGRGIFDELLFEFGKKSEDEDHNFGRYLINPFCLRKRQADSLYSLSMEREMLASTPYGFILKDQSSGNQAIVSFEWFQDEAEIESFRSPLPFLSSDLDLNVHDIFIHQIQGYTSRTQGTKNPFPQILWPELLTCYVANFAYFGGLKRLFYLPRELVRPERFRVRSSSDWIYRQVPERLGFTRNESTFHNACPYMYAFSENAQ